MKRFDSINVIPFIDIMLVLLAIVLTTATFIAQGKIDIDLPKSSQTTPPPSDPPVVITIDRHAAIFHNDHPMALEALPACLEPVAKDTPIVLRVDAAVPFSRFVEVVDILKAQQLDRLSIVTQQQAQ